MVRLCAIWSGADGRLTTVLVGLCCACATAVGAILIYAFYFASVLEIRLANHQQRTKRVVPQLRLSCHLAGQMHTDKLLQVISQASYLNRHAITDMAKFACVEIAGIQSSTRSEWRLLVAELMGPDAAVLARTDIGAVNRTRIGTLVRAFTEYISSSLDDLDDREEAAIVADLQLGASICFDASEQFVRTVDLILIRLKNIDGQILCQFAKNNPAVY